MARVVRLGRQARAIDDGEHAVADLPILRLANFRAQLNRASIAIRHFEEPDRQPHCKHIASRCQVIEDLGE